VASREQWSQWVRGWERSGLTAAQYAEDEGIHPGTLTHWRWRLRRDARERREQQQARAGAQSTSFVEVSPEAMWWQTSERIEIVVGEVVVRVPDVFETATLRRVLDAIAGEEADA
jgi:transposase